MPLFNKGGYQLDNLIHVLRSQGIVGCTLYAQGIGILEVFGYEFVRQLADGNALPVGPCDHLVLDVGEVLHKGYFVAAELQIPSEYVEDNEGTGVSYVKIVIDRRTACIKTHMSFFYRDKRFFGPGQIIVKNKAH